MSEDNATLTWAGILNPEMRKLIPVFWLNFNPPSVQIQHILGIIYIIIITIGISANAIVLITFFSTKKLQKPANYLVINLALSDILMLHKMVIFIYNSFQGGPDAGPFWCQYYGLVGGLSGTSAIMTIAMMSLERHICVTRLLHPSCRLTRNQALIMLLFIWTYSAVWSFLPLFGVGRYVPEGFLTSCSFDYLSEKTSSRLFIFCYFVAAYCTPMAIISRCYLGIILSFHRSHQFFLRHSHSLEIEKHKRLEMKLVKISFGLVCLWILSWTPYAIVALMGVLGSRSMLTPLSSMLPALFCKFAAVLDPFVYGLSNPQFKRELVKKLQAVFQPRNEQNRQIVVFLRSQRRTSVEDDCEFQLSEGHCEIVLRENRGDCVPGLLRSE